MDYHDGMINKKYKYVFLFVVLGYGSYVIHHILFLIILKPEMNIEQEVKLVLNFSNKNSNQKNIIYGKVSVNIFEFFY